MVYPATEITTVFQWERDVDPEAVKVIDLTVTATVSEWHPPKLSGPPESCYEAEGGEITIKQVIDRDGEDYSKIAEVEELAIKAVEKVINNDLDYPYHFGG